MHTRGRNAGGREQVAPRPLRSAAARRSFAMPAMPAGFLRVLSALGFGLCHISGARAADATNGPAPQLKPYQHINAGLQPLAPDAFNPDAGTRLPDRFRAGGFSIKYDLLRETNRVPPAQFNPDPGASLRKPAAAPALEFFQYEYAAPPVFSGEAVPPAMELPRNGVHETELLLREPHLPRVRYGFDMLPANLALPRSNTVENLPVPSNWRANDYPLTAQHAPNEIPVPNRYRVPFVPWRRYTSGDFSDAETPYEHAKTYWWHPYFQSYLKGDSPILGRDIFLDLTASTETELEFRRIPTPSGISSARPGSADFFGRSEQWSVQNNVSFTLDLFRGETVFKPVEWAIRLQPVYNINFVDVRETTVVRPDPRGYDATDNRPSRGSLYNVSNPGDVRSLLDGVTPVGNSLANRSHTQRTKDFIALQEAFAEVHIRDLSVNYDFIAARVGNQTFNSDFRGFIFNDVDTGARLFGNYDNNLWQYNLAAFDMREKDTYSELNSLEQRDQRVVILNVYRQDAIWHGYTAQASFHANIDDGGTHYDRNGNLVRPALLGDVRPHEVQAYYFGWAGDGHIGRWNVSHAFYQAVGHDTFNGLAGRPVDINAQMGALELSYDRDWIRYKASFFYASGDGKAEDGTATGFDTIFDNPNFTGGPFSYWVHQGFNLGGTAVNLKQRNSLVPDLRTSKGEGQANFVNPGAFLYSVGAEVDTTPKLRTFLNINYIRFVETDSIKTALLTDKADAEVGWDFSIGWQYRPLLTDNIIVSAGFGTLLPGTGFRDIYRRSTAPLPGYESTNRRGAVDDFLYSGILALTLTY